MLRRVVGPCVSVSVRMARRELSIMDKAGGMFGNMGNMWVSEWLREWVTAW